MRAPRGRFRGWPSTTLTGAPRFDSNRWTVSGRPQREGTAAYLASLRLDQARGWKEFMSGAGRHYMPSLNMTLADVGGNVGWSGTSAAPVRKGWAWMLPVPGDGEYEWQDYLDPSKLPRMLNPPAGWIATANQYNLPPRLPAHRGLRPRVGPPVPIPAHRRCARLGPPDHRRGRHAPPVR